MTEASLAKRKAELAERKAEENAAIGFMSNVRIYQNLASRFWSEYHSLSV